MTGEGDHRSRLLLPRSTLLTGTGRPAGIRLEPARNTHRNPPFSSLSHQSPADPHKSVASHAAIPLLLISRAHRDNLNRGFRRIVAMTNGAKVGGKGATNVLNGVRRLMNPIS